MESETAADTLERLLVTLAVRLHAFAICEIQRGWRLAFDPMDAVTIHYVLAGHGVLRTTAGASVAFEPYSIIIVPSGIGQSLGASIDDADDQTAVRHPKLVDDVDWELMSRLAGWLNEPKSETIPLQPVRQENADRRSAGAARSFR